MKNSYEINKLLNEKIIERKLEMDSLLSECEKFLDIDFKSHYSRNPYSRIFELVVCKNLLDNSRYINFKIDPKLKNSEGPDFCMISKENPFIRRKNI